MPRPTHRLIRIALAVATAAAPLIGAPSGALAAADPPNAAKPAEKALAPELWKLTIRAKAIQTPALQFALLPGPADQVSGNAAPMYLLAASQADRIARVPVNAEEMQRKGLPPTPSDDLLDYYGTDVPLTKIPLAELKQLLAPYSQVFQSLDSATRREACEWNLPIRELGFETALPHLNSARNLANVSSIRARLLVAEGEYTQAIWSLRTIFRLGQNLANEGMLIQSLVGTGIGAVGAKRLQEMIQQPDMPNMYWPLATLPRPFISMSQSLEWERTGLLATFPQLRAAQSGNFTAEDWASFITTLPTMGTRGYSFPEGRQQSAGSTIGAAMAGTMLYPEAKKYLIGQGMPAAEVESMPAPQALGRYIAGQYQTVFDEMVKWSALPFWQGREGMQNIEQDLRRGGPSQPAIRGVRPMEGNERYNNPAMMLFMTAIPSVAPAAHAAASLDRQIAALQTVEALRHHAATHDGKLPASLDELKDTPAPIDPMTGKPFAYRVQDNVATLESPGGLPGRRGFQVEVTLAK